MMKWRLSTFKTPNRNGMYRYFFHITSSIYQNIITSPFYHPTFAVKNDLKYINDQIKGLRKMGVFNFRFDGLIKPLFLCTLPIIAGISGDIYHCNVWETISC